MSLLDLVAEARRSGDVTSLGGATPYTRYMNIAPENSTGELLTRMRYDPKLIGNIMLPALHGGTIGALLEAAAIFQVLWEIETIAVPKIITITVDYLRSGRPVDTLARAVLTKQGRRVVNVAVEAWQDDRSRPIASANAHFLVSPREE
jgi:acyl-coenzyme A thioesterase PaaI-like protein